MNESSQAAMSAEDLLARLAAEPARTGLFLDFDGTLCDIVADPAASRMTEGLEPVLADLAAHLGAVAIVSGRPVTFLAQRAAVPGVRLLGLYGLEEWRDGAPVPRPEAAGWQEAVDHASAHLQAALADEEGVRVEDKGLAVAVHWRNAPDPAAAERRVTRLTAELAEATGLAHEPGKLVDELRPPVEWDKGAAVRAVVSEQALAPLAYLGDDLGDLAAFEAVRDAEGFAVAVDHGAETPAALRTAADVLLDGPAEVARWLTRLRDATVG